MTTRVLVAMREGLRRDEVVGALEQHGMNAVSVRSGELAIDRFITDSFQGLIVQLDLPGRDGAATIESIRWAPGGTAIATVLIGTNARSIAPVAQKLDVENFLAHETTAIVQSLKTQMAEQSSAITKIVEAPVVQRFAPPTQTTPNPLDTIPSASLRPPSAMEARYVEEAAADVELTARLSGTLEETSFATVLARLAELRADGALLVESEDDSRLGRDEAAAKKLLFVRRGVPVYVQSNLEEECLGQILLKYGKIDRAQLDESIRRVLEGEGKQGGVLISMGALEPAGLREGLELEQLEKTLDLFSWEAGRFSFTETLEPPPTTVSLELPLPELLLRGVRERIDGTRLITMLEPNAARYVVPTARPSHDFRSHLEEGAASLFAAIDGTLTVQTLVDSGQPSRIEAARVLFVAQALGLVAFRAAAEETLNGQTEPEGARAISRVRRLERLLREGRYAEALGVDRRDSEGAAEAVAEAEETMRAIVAHSELAELRESAQEVLARLPRAALALGEATSPSTTSEELDEQVSRVLQAERLFRRGREALEGRRAAEALALLAKAVELAPDEGEFLIYLGAARYRAAESTTEREHALAELTEATLRMPKMYAAHLHLARALCGEGEFRRARHAYTRALEAHPTGEEALSELQALPA